MKQLWTDEIPYISDLLAKRNYYVPSQYRIYARNIATGAETYIGSIDQGDSALRLSGITLANATYEIIFRLQGFHWHEHEMIKRWIATVAGGQVQAPEPPPVYALDYEQLGSVVSLSWVYPMLGGILEPDEYGVWYSSVGAPNPAIPPDETVSASGPGNYSVRLSQGTGQLFVAVAARKSGVNGPVSTLTIPAPSTSPSSPESQWIPEDEE